jgi:hypothetical protein
MKTVALCLVVALALAFVGEAARITSLPGWQPTKPYAMYSGYINLEAGKKYFYWYDFRRKWSSNELFLLLSLFSRLDDW